MNWKKLCSDSFIWQFNLGSAQWFFCPLLLGTCICRPQSMSRTSAGMAVTAEKPGSFPRGHSLYLGFHPQVGQFWLSHRWWCSKRAWVEAARPLEAEAPKSHNVTLLYSIGQSKLQWQQKLKLTGKAAKNLWLLSSTTQFQHVHHPEANAV